MPTAAMMAVMMSVMPPVTAVRQVMRVGETTV
jgi:hypothetical protein